jgi:hypothetical protein
MIKRIFADNVVSPIPTAVQNLNIKTQTFQLNKIKQ